MFANRESEPVSLHDLPYGALVELLSGWGFSEFHARRLWELLYTDLRSDVAGSGELRADLRQKLSELTVTTGIERAVEVQSRDGQTVKFLLSLEDGETIETVLMRYPGRSIACISTQAGCAMGCVFCATGQMGFVRHLRPGEIVAQVLYVVRRLREQGETLRNVVFMGMGEPLHNYQATIEALSIMMDDRGLALAPKHITLSTVGLPKGIRQLADDDVGVNLAVSLHGSNDQDRVAIVPVAHRWSLDEIIAACHYYTDKRRRRIFFEWALIAGTNDDPETAHELGQLLAGLDAHVNLIPLNPTESYAGLPSSPQAIQDFQTILASYGFPSTVRQRRGIDIDAGCGQLRARAARQQA